MHYKDGTPATLGDIVLCDAGHVGMVIGGQVGNDFYTTQVVRFCAPGQWGEAGAGYAGVLRDSAGKLIARGGVAVAFDANMQTREMMKIGHVDIGQG